MCRLRLPRRAPRNVAYESTVTRPQLAPSANAISNFPEADFWPGIVSGCPVIRPEHSMMHRNSGKRWATFGGESAVVWVSPFHKGSIRYTG